MTKRMESHSDMLLDYHAYKWLRGRGRCRQLRVLVSTSASPRSYEDDASSEGSGGTGRR